MRSLRGALVLAGAAFGVGSMSALMMAGCSGDNSTASAVDSGGDAQGDVTSDQEIPDQTADTQADTGTDSGITPDSGPIDSGQQDSSSGDAADAGHPALDFATAEATAICNLWQPCCPVTDAGAYSLSGCIASFQGYGWEANLPYNQNALVRPHITVDQAKATACLAAINSTNIPCGHQTAAGYSAVTAACEGVLQGSIPIGQTGCISSFECAPGAYCDTATAGGTCTALSPVGGPCYTVINTPYNPIPDEMCSYLGSSSNGHYCDIIDPPDSSTYATCQPLLANGATCQTFTTPGTSGFYYDDQACPAAGALCGDPGTCGTTASFPYAGGGVCSFH